MMILANFFQMESYFSHFVHNNSDFKLALLGIFESVLYLRKNVKHNFLISSRMFC